MLGLCCFPPFLRSRFLCFFLSPTYRSFIYGVFVPFYQVMHAAAYHVQPPPTAQGHADPLYASVGHLLSKACSNTCFTAAQAFAQLVQPTARFQLALDALLPILDSPRSEVSQSLSHHQQKPSADMLMFILSSTLSRVAVAPATNPCGIYTVFLIRTTPNCY